MVPHNTLLWSRINANTDLASHHNPNDIQQNIELVESLMNEMCAIKPTVEEAKDKKNNHQNQPMTMKDHPYGKDIRAMSSKCYLNFAVRKDKFLVK
jgi:hypothetical protein